MYNIVHVHRVGWREKEQEQERERERERDKGERYRRMVRSTAIAGKGGRAGGRVPEVWQSTYDPVANTTVGF